MKVAGLQKLTLLDYPGKVACTIFLPGCNFRCPFCHNAALVTNEQADTIKEEDLFAFLKKRQGILDGVCITGGEPLLQQDLADLIGDIKKLGYAVKLDTNGSMPERLEALIRDGLLDMVAMDIKNTPPKYAETAGATADFSERICRSVALLKQGAIPYEFRTTVVKEFHRVEDFAQIGCWLAEGLGEEDLPEYYLQAFVDSGDLIGSGYHAFERDEMIAALNAVKQWIPKASIRGMS